MGLQLSAVKVLEAFRSVNECFAVFFEARKAASLVAWLASLVSQCFPMFQQSKIACSCLLHVF